MRKKKRLKKWVIPMFICVLVLLLIFIYYTSKYFLVEDHLIIDNSNHSIVNVSCNKNILCIDNNVYVRDNDYDDILDIFDIDGEYKISGEYDLTKSGGYDINISDHKYVLNVLDRDVKYNSDGSLVDNVYLSNKNYLIKVIDGIARVDDLIIVNKTFSLPSSYKPSNPYHEISSIGYCTDCIEDFVMEAFLEMLNDAKKEGLNMKIGSGFRSYNTQVNLYDSYVKADGKKEADTYSARAGYSEHQSGLCFDIYPNRSSFTNTNEGKWVNENAYKYGLTIRFPQNGDEYTGYQYESWHLRYVGKDLALKLYNGGNWISIEEYYGLTSIYP